MHNNNAWELSLVVISGKKCNFLSGKQFKNSEWIKNWKFSCFWLVFWVISKLFRKLQTYKHLKFHKQQNDAKNFFILCPRLAPHSFEPKKYRKNGQTTQTCLVQIPDFYAQSPKYFVLILILHMLTCYYAVLSKDS
jgi:hypothetical protein